MFGNLKFYAFIVNEVNAIPFNNVNAMHLVSQCSN